MVQLQQQAQKLLKQQQQEFQQALAHQARLNVPGKKVLALNLTEVPSSSLSLREQQKGHHGDPDDNNNNNNSKKSRSSASEEEEEEEDESLDASTKDTDSANQSGDSDHDGGVVVDGDDEVLSDSSGEPTESAPSGSSTTQRPGNDMTPARLASYVSNRRQEKEVITLSFFLLRYVTIIFIYLERS